MATTMEEGQTMLWLAAPAMISSYCLFAISLMELGVIGHRGVDQLAGVAFAQMAIDFSTLVFMQGFNAGTNALCSQAFGADNPHLLRLYAWASAWLQTATCLPLALLWWHMDRLLLLTGVSETVVVFARMHCRLSILGMWPRYMFQVTLVYLQSQRIVWPSALANVCSVLVNALLTVGLVNGRFGLPSLGFIGCAIGTALTFWLRFLVLISYVILADDRVHPPKLRSWTMGLRDLGRFDTLSTLLSVALPLVLGNLFENSQLQVMAVMAASIGSPQLATHNSMMELFFFLMSPVLGIMDASITRIGHHLGSGRAANARTVAGLSAVAIAVVSLGNSLLCLLFDRRLGGIFSGDPAVTSSFTSIAPLGAMAFLVVGFFSYTMTVLEAQTRTSPILVAFVTGAWVVGIPTAFVLCRVRRDHDADAALTGVWWGMLSGYVTTTSIGLYAAVWENDWARAARDAVARSTKRGGCSHDPPPSAHDPELVELLRPLL